MKILNKIIANFISWAGTISLENTSTGNIADFKVNGTTKSSVDTNGKYTGTLDWSSVNNKPDPTITLGGDLSGSVTLTDLNSGTLTATVSDDSHNHIVGNVDGLQTTLNGKANLASPTFTGTPKAPTAIGGTNTTQLATTAFVQSAMSGAGLGDMLKSQFATNVKVADGYVDKSIMSDNATNAEKVNGFTVGKSVPSNALFTDTVYTHPATHSADMITDGTTNKVFTATERTKLGGIATNANNYSHPTTAGNKHIPTGGASGQVLKYSASGTAVWGADDNTITTVNGKTGAISKADIVALGIPAQDTVYTHPTTHSISEVSGLQTALDGKVDDSQVLTNVPLNAKFTDTVYSHPSTHSASMITESTSKRFVADTEKASWNSKTKTVVSSTTPTGMATGDLWYQII